MRTADLNIDFEFISLISQSKLFESSIGLVLKDRAKSVFFCNLDFNNNILSLRHLDENTIKRSRSITSPQNVDNIQNTIDCTVMYGF